MTLHPFLLLSGRNTDNSNGRSVATLKERWFVYSSGEKCTKRKESVKTMESSARRTSRGGIGRMRRLDTCVCPSLGRRGVGCRGIPMDGRGRCERVGLWRRDRLMLWWRLTMELVLPLVLLMNRHGCRCGIVTMERCSSHSDLIRLLYACSIRRRTPDALRRVEE